MSMRFSKARSLVVVGALAVAGLLALFLLQNPATTRARTVLAPLLWQTGQTVVSLEFDDATADQNEVRSLLASHGSARDLLRQQRDRRSERLSHEPGRSCTICPKTATRSPGTPSTIPDLLAPRSA